jgi:hypothetical protein
MIDASANGLAAATVNMLRLDPPPTEAEIDDILARMSSAFAANANTTLEARRLLHARFAIRMDLGSTLTGNEDHVPWSDEMRGSIDPFYWTRYREFLIRGGWSPLVASTLDRSTEELLDLLGNPSERSEWKRRGLVVGDVQSGKTAAYAALICKAADAGYRMIILLTGTLENVRRQTQERLDAAFIGFDSRDRLGTEQARPNGHIGVGLINGERGGVVFTSRDTDFKKNGPSAVTLPLKALNEPALVVTKKNKAILNRLAKWLRERNREHDGKIDLSLLLIDDEADNASINTRKDSTETTAINRAIRDLLALFTRSSYVGFTATPFANIFIDPLSTHDMIGDDLFPSDFIHVLEPPTNYVGMNSLFPRADPDDLTPDDQDFSIIQSIDETEDWMPEGHQKEFEPGPIPESLMSALRCFLLACALRDLRAANGVEGRGGGLHRSMLVNVSRFTAVQDKIAALLHYELEEIRRAVRLFGSQSTKRAAEQSPEIDGLADEFSRFYSQCGFSWAVVLSTLHEAIGPVKVQAVNQRTGASVLDYGIVDRPPGVRVIAVGGNSLSRGLTLEGLSTSYFLRNSKAYDTLLQMGRWFGYRDGYADLCKIWLSDQADSWYRHVTEATAELKQDFARMKRRKATPREFGLRVRTHPDTLLITARNKMATGLDVVEQRDISLMGRMVESTRLYSDRGRNLENKRTIDRFVSTLVDDYGQPIPSDFSGAIVWRKIPAIRIADLLDIFLVHPLNFGFQSDSIATFLRESIEGGDPLVSHWSVALLTSGKGENTFIPALPDAEISLKERKVKQNREDGSLLVSGKSARLGSAPDVRHGLSREVVDAVLKNEKQLDPDQDKFPDGACRAAMNEPLLIIYLLQGMERIPSNGGFERRRYRDDLVLPALALHFPGSPDPDAPRHLVRYRLGPVAKAMLISADSDDDDVDGDNETDD